MDEKAEAAAPSITVLIILSAVRWSGSETDRSACEE